MKERRNTRRNRRNAGFTMAEVLLVVAILGILAAVTFVGVTSMQKGIRQKGLDTKAETIYVAVQNQLTKLRTGGMNIKYQPSPDGEATGLTVLPGEPVDWEAPAVITASGEIKTADMNLYQIVKDSAGGEFADPQAAFYLMAEDTVDESLRSHYWVIEYDPKTADVYSVFYWEDEEQGPASAGSADGYDFAKFNSLRITSERKAAGSWVGYYSSNVIQQSSSLTGKNDITLTNGEKLFGVFQYSFSAIPSKQVVMTITLKDQHGHTQKVVYRSGTPGLGERQLTQKGRRFYCTMMFDDLQSSSTRFYNVYGKGNASLNDAAQGKQPLVAGDNITVSMEISIPDDNTFIAKSYDGGTFNSLYADDSVLSAEENPEEVTYAHIACIRHLQNLDMEWMAAGYESHVDKVTGALQTSDLSFRKDNNNSANWYAVYPEAEKTEDRKYLDQTGDNITFVPIRNSNLKTYEASQDGEGDTKIYHTIVGLPVKVTEDGGSAGLFEKLADTDETVVSNVCLTGAQVFATGTNSSAGALFGTVTHKLKINDCRVYLNEADGDLEAQVNGAKASPVNPWISGTASGGLIGTVADGADVKVTNSFASLVLGSVDGGLAKEGTSAGGLAGQVKGGTISFNGCYADSYIIAEKAGGLVGSSTGGVSDVKLSACYAAGFLTVSGTNAEGAGLVDGLADISNSYAFMTRSGTGEGAFYSTAAIGSTVSDVFYYTEGSAVVSGEGPGAATTYLNVEGTQSFIAMKAEDLLSALGAPFTTSTEDGTSPYNLTPGMALDSYPYPHLTGLRHYGDWQTDFVQGALVYYELYKSAASSVRFYGGNVSTLYDNLEVGAVKGDGYGIVYRSDAASRPATVTVTTGFGQTETITLASAPKYSYSDDQGFTYDVYPLSVGTVNPVINADSAYNVPVKVVYDAKESAELYYFSPHFARSAGYLRTISKDADITSTDILASVPKLADDAVIYVRSARHLYNMSLYYKYYRLATKGRNFRQTWELSYTDYDWSTFTAFGNVDKQNPIGLADSPFEANYNGGGYKIDNISFVLEQGKNGTSPTFYAGLFGRNEGEIKNVVLWAEYDEDGGSQYYISTDANVGMNQTMYMGALAGYNAASGRISNCAVAGYYLANSSGTIRGYSNSYIYAGGLIGGNANGGVISNCSADTPFVRVSTTYATAYVAGFAGENHGNIRNCYALGHIEVVSPTGGSIGICGFVGSNSGDVSSCYAAVNLQTSGDMTTAYPFSADTGSISGCDYLNVGTYSYANHLYSFGLTGGAGSATLYEEMKTKSVRYSYNYSSVRNGGDGYPYRGVVTDTEGNLVHYGDWQKYADLGTLGLFYWEEEDGGNLGYHVTFVGLASRKSSDGRPAFEADTTLCSAHDDGGNITQYGYGYYKKKNDTDSSVSIKIGGTEWNSLTPNTTAGTELGKQFKDFTFTAFNTTPANNIDTNGNKQLYLTGNAANDTWEITKYKEEHGARETQITMEYEVSPFFANAMKIVKVNGVAASGNVTVKMPDGQTRNFTKALGTDSANGYDIRNISQMQYINWNSANKNVSTLVTNVGGIYQKYPYLAYATVLTGDNNNKQTRDGAGNKIVRYFTQTHDFTSDAGLNYTPIAAAGTSSSGTKYTATLYTWFGSSFDGQSYKMKNVAISSNANAVGLFGVTVSASINNIIMYSDADTVIERKAEVTDKDGAYVLGGLVGVAYRYFGEDTSKNPITNCAIAGYRIVDSSKRFTTAGGTCVGGLVGVADVDILNCSAVTDIDMAATRPGAISYFDTIRVGGLCAALPGKARNCYTGGTIKVTGGVLTSEKTVNVNDDGQSKQAIELKESSSIYIAGIAASGFSMNFQNFTGQQGSREGIPVVENSYTYMQFPALTGTIRQITMITSLADRFRQATPAHRNVTINNCYYLASSAEFDVTEAGDKLIKDDMGDKLHGGISEGNGWNSLRVIFNGPKGTENKQNMVNGDVEYMFEMRGINPLKADSHPARLSVDAGTAPKTVTYEALSNQDPDVNGEPQQTENNMAYRLNASASSPWGWVTTKQGTAAIDGKFSFPGAKPELTGLNYPFPTVVRQNDLVYGGKVNVHYGSWVLNGAYWETARNEMDIFRDRKPTETEALKTIRLRAVKNAALTAETLNNGMQVKGIFEVKSVTKTANSDGKTYDYDVVFKALKAGSDEVTFTDTDSVTTKLTMEVTAFLNVATLPGEIKQSAGKETELTLYAHSMAAENNDYSTAPGITWEVKSKNTDIEANEDITLKEGTTNVYKVKGTTSGRTQLVVKATAAYGDQTFEATQYVSLLNYGVVGLSNNGIEGAYEDGPNQPFFSQVSRGDEDAQGENVTLTTAPSYTDDGTAELYLYESADDQALGKAQIISKEVTDKNGHTLNYVVTVSDTVIMDENYSYRKVTVRPPEGSAGENVTVTIELKDNDTGAQYTLSGKIRASHVVTYDLAGGDATQLAATFSRIKDGAAAIGKTGIAPPGGDPERAGYAFKGWKLDGQGNPYNVGAMIDGIKKDGSMVAQWEAKKYTVKYHSNRPVSFYPSPEPRPAGYTSPEIHPHSPTEEQWTYGTQITLQGAGIFTAVAPPGYGYTMVGWNTKADYSGTAFAFGSTLTSMPLDSVKVEGEKEVIYLYAQWADTSKVKLTFKDNFLEATDEKLSSEVDLMGVTSAPYPVENAVLPDRVKDAEQQTIHDIKGYYWTDTDGESAGTYRLLGWSLNADASEPDAGCAIGDDGTLPVLTVTGPSTYYAVWKKVTYTVILMSGGSEYARIEDLSGTELELATAVNAAAIEKPTKTDYVLTGFYDKALEANDFGTKQAADNWGIINQDGKGTVADYAKNFEWTIYARFRKEVSGGYFPIASVTPNDGQAIKILFELGDKTYAIRSSEGVIKQQVTMKTVNEFCTSDAEGKTPIAIGTKYTTDSTGNCLWTYIASTNCLKRYNSSYPYIIAVPTTNDSYTYQIFDRNDSAQIPAFIAAGQRFYYVHPFGEYLTFQAPETAVGADTTFYVSWRETDELKYYYDTVNEPGKKKNVDFLGESGDASHKIKVKYYYEVKKVYLFAD